jgi:hypothetical protein
MGMPRSVYEIIEQAEGLAEHFESFEPAAEDRASARSLVALHRAALSRARAEAKLVEVVARARDDGHSWAAIGTMLGTSGEAARQRYGGKRNRSARAI